MRYGTAQDHAAWQQPKQAAPPPVTYAAQGITIHVDPGAGKADLLQAIHFLAGLHCHRGAL
jgi:hypothetical protein